MPVPEPARVDPMVRLAASGDARARAEVVRAYGPLVWTLCRRLDPDPEDSYQEVWAKVLAALPRFDPDGPASLRTWIATVTHRHLVDRARRRKARGEVVDLGELAAPADPERSDVDRLLAALDRLPDEHRRVVVMFHLHEQPLEHIAREEGVALGTVKSRLHRARARLLELLGGR